MHKIKNGKMWHQNYKIWGNGVKYEALECVCI